MSVWGRRGTYGATVFVVAFWIVLSTGAHLASPFIEKQENSAMASSDSDFMREARFQSVKWRSWGPDALLESRRTGKPIFLVAGTSWGELREIYDGLFSVEEISEYLNQEFVSIRVDSLVSPEWRSPPSPIVRSLRNDPRDFFIGIFTSDGKIVDIPSREVLLSKNDATLLAYLKNQLGVYGGRNETPFQRDTIEEVSDMRGRVSSGLTDGDQYLAMLKDRIFVLPKLVPHELDFMLDAGQVDQVEQIVEQYLGSSVVDVIWGGFFDIWDGRFDQIRFVKSSFSNAGMLKILSRLGVSTGDPALIGAARWQFDYVSKRFAGETATSGDSVPIGDAGRSIIYSFPNSRLRGLLSGGEVKLAQEGLGLKPGGKAQALAKFVDRRDWENGGERFENVIKKLHGGVADPESVQGGTQSYEAQAVAIQAMLVSARLLNDDQRKSEAVEAFKSLRERMRIGLDDVTAGPPDQLLIEEGLGSYLSYVGAAWEAMLSTGDSEIGWDGTRVLNRALFLYRDDNESLWSGSIDAMNSEWRSIIPPPVMDGTERAAMADLIRLCDLYGNWRGSKSYRGSLLRGRDRAANQVSWILDECGPGFGSLAQAVRQVNRGYAIGYSGSVDWGYFEKHFPGVPLMPVWDEEGGPGFRLMHKGDWSGPYQLSELERLVH
ncbi:MAG: DUF255 domain-containing protein [Fimbriimonadaceae bacterium]